MAIWPAALPTSFLIDGYAISPADQNIRSDMEVGTPRVRRRTFARDDNVPGSMVLTKEQMAIFRSWFDGTGADDCHGGSAWFNGLSLEMGDGGITTPDCRFIGPYTATRVSGTPYWSVSAKLEVR